MFTDVIDPATPGDDEGISQGDDRIRELKRAVNERMASAFANWPEGDPLVLKTSAIPLVDGIVEIVSDELLVLAPLSINNTLSWFFIVQPAAGIDPVKDFFNIQFISRTAFLGASAEFYVQSIGMEQFTLIAYSMPLPGGLVPFAQSTSRITVRVRRLRNSTDV